MKKQDFEYEVALSFAGEQRDYVEKVSKELTRLNVGHFYDYNEQVNLLIVSILKKQCILFLLFQKNM